MTVEKRLRLLRPSDGAGRASDSTRPAQSGAEPCQAAPGTPRSLGDEGSVL